MQAHKKAIVLIKDTEGFFGMDRDSESSTRVVSKSVDIDFFGFRTGFTNGGEYSSNAGPRVAEGLVVDEFLELFAKLGVPVRKKTNVLVTQLINEL